MGQPARHPLSSRLDALGLSIEQAWRSADYDDVRLPEIAERGLREHALPESFSCIDVVRWANELPALPEQFDIDSSFGQPPLTLYHGSRFYIEALFWLDGTPSIHSHRFTGAFQVLEGSSIHSVYEFAERERINGNIRIGEIRPQLIEVLRKGDVRRILPGDALVHSTFHLDTPTISLLVRTPGMASSVAQFSFYPPGFAMNGFYSSKTAIRRRQLLRMLSEIGHPEYESELVRLIQTDDLENAVLYLELDLLQRGSLEKSTPVFSALRTRHGQKAEPLISAAHNAMREAIIRRLRREVRDVRLRFFLAVALLAWDRKSALSLLAARFPKESPLDVAVECVRVLASRHSEASGLSLSETDEAALRVLLSDSTPKQTAGTSDRVQALRDQFRLPSILAAFVRP